LSVHLFYSLLNVGARRLTPHSSINIMVLVISSTRVLQTDYDSSHHKIEISNLNVQESGVGG